MANRISPDGKGLEKLVSRIYEELKDNPLAEVIHDIQLPNSYGRLSQFDVIIKIRIAGKDIMIAIECKDYEGAIELGKISEFAVKCEQVKGIGRRIFVVVNGYQSGAIGVAGKYDIELYHLNEVSPELLKSWVKWERSYVTYPEKRQIGAIRFHIQGGKVISYEGDNLPNLNMNLVLQSPGVEPVILGNLISWMGSKDGFYKGLLEFAGEDFRKLTISGDEKLVTIPILVQGIPETPYITALEGFQVQVNKVEFVFEHIYRISRFEEVIARSYQTNEGETEAEVLVTKVGEMRLEIIKNIVNETTSFYVFDSAGQIHKIDQDRVK